MFDCLPPDILLSKLSAYGLSSKSVKLLGNYLTGRKQQTKSSVNGLTSLRVCLKVLYSVPCFLTYLYVVYFVLWSRVLDNMITICVMLITSDNLMSILLKESTVLISNGSK